MDNGSDLFPVVDKKFKQEISDALKDSTKESEIILLINDRNKESAQLYIHAGPETIYNTCAELIKKVHNR